MGVAKKKRKPRALPKGRLPGEQWFEVVEAFDPNKIRRLPIPGRAFLMGKIGEVLIIEVPDLRAGEVDRLREMLAAAGIEGALIVQQGVRFLKLGPVDLETSRRLDSTIEKLEAVKREQAAQATEEHQEAPSAEPGSGDDPHGVVPD